CQGSPHSLLCPPRTQWTTGGGDGSSCSPRPSTLFNHTIAAFLQCPADRRHGAAPAPPPVRAASAAPAQPPPAGQRGAASWGSSLLHRKHSKGEQDSHSYEEEKRPDTHDWV
ncbi:hypothetical protein GN956_G26892, partial [Arapaima gigas]